MKTYYSFRQYLPAMVFTLAIMAFTADAGAQNHRNKNRGNEDSRKEFRDYKNDDRDERKYSNNKHRSDQKEYNKKHSQHKEAVVYTPHYSKKYGHSYRNYSVHPRYGKVYQKFDHKPFVFRHKHSDYYYFGNQFYTYRKGIGYYVVEAPRNVYFSELPFRCERVYANGHVYYRNGDMFFIHSPRGYVIAPPPVQVNLSLRF